MCLRLGGRAPRWVGSAAAAAPRRASGSPCPRCAPIPAPANQQCKVAMSSAGKGAAAAPAMVRMLTNASLAVWLACAKVSFSLSAAAPGQQRQQHSQRQLQQGNSDGSRAASTRAAQPLPAPAWGWHGSSAQRHRCQHELPSARPAGVAGPTGSPPQHSRCSPVTIMDMWILRITGQGHQATGVSRRPSNSHRLSCECTQKAATRDAGTGAHCRLPCPVDLTENQ